MVKELTENPKLRFKTQDGTIATVSMNGCLAIKTEDNDEGEARITSGLAKYKPDEWERVPEEVTWQEAIQAKLDGEEFSIEYNGNTYTQKSFSKIGYLESSDKKDQDGKLKGFYTEMFRSGKWFVL